MDVLFLGGPLDGQVRDIDLPLTETVAWLPEDNELTRVDTYKPDVRPYFLHSVLLDTGIAQMYSTTPDFIAFSDQLARYEYTAEYGTEIENDPEYLPPPVSPASLPRAPDETLAISAPVAETEFIPLGEIWVGSP